MFNNTIKKFASVGLVFSLCVPCCFASAQKMPPNPFIPSNSGGNRTNRQDIGDFTLFLSVMLQVAQIQLDRPRTQPSALERLWTEYGGRDVITVQGRHLETVQEFVNEIRRIGTPAPIISLAVLHHLIKEANLSLNDAIAMTQEVIAEIYNLDKIESGRYAMQVLADLKAHPIHSKLIFK